MENEKLILWRERVREEALRLGFSRAGFTTAEPLDAVVERRWERWRKLGLAGVMRYLMRPYPRRTHPTDLLPEAQTIILAAAGYYDGDHPATPPEGAEASHPPLHGKVARYAWGIDYHPALRERLGRLARWIEENAGNAGWSEPIHWRAVADSAPLDERSFAARAGLGFIGKNTLLLMPLAGGESGSWALLAALLISVPFPPDSPLPAAPEHSCGGCRKCLEVCPTNAFDAPFQLDPRRCISYLTIEQKEPIPPPLDSRMEGWVFGCDLCQEVCPFNDAPLALKLPEFARDQGVGPIITTETLAETPTGKAFLRRWGRTPLARVGLKGMLRNFAPLLRGRKDAE